jgi:hypothetical protein
MMRLRAGFGRARARTGGAPRDRRSCIAPRGRRRDWSADRRLHCARARPRAAGAGPADHSADEHAGRPRHLDAPDRQCDPGLARARTYVAPNGARAASAGTYIAYASAIAAMAPGTNIGAATPVQFGGSPALPLDQGQKKEQKQQEAKPGEAADAETRKAVNDAAAYIRSLAALNDRNADWAAEAVRSAASLPAAEALSLHVIDVVADDVPDLLRKIDGRTGDGRRQAAAARDCRP